MINKHLGPATLWFLISDGDVSVGRVGIENKICAPQNDADVQ